jgi:hypothetical protein
MSDNQVASGRARRALPELMITLGVLALSLAGLLSTGRRAVFFPDNFADNLAASLRDPRVAAFVADRVTDAVLKEQPDLTAFRPLILGTTRDAVGSPAFQALVRGAARTAHASLFSEGGRTVIVSIPDVGVLMRSALQKANPALAARIPERAKSVLASIGQRRADQVILRVWQVASRTFWLAAALLGFGVVLILGGVAFIPDRRVALVRLGLDLVVAGVVFMLISPAGRALAGLIPESPLARQAAAGLWDAFTGPLRGWALMFGGSGLVLAAAGHSLIARLDPLQTLRALADLLTNPPGGVRGQLAKSALLLLGGAGAMIWPAKAASFAIVLLGAFTAFAGLREIFDLVLRASPREAASMKGDSASSATVRVALVLSLAVAFLAGIAYVGRPDTRVRGGVVGACNGSPDLCGRRLDEVVFPSTHNAMSSADIPDWMLPQQEAGIAEQLDDGIRGLLFDVHYGIPVEGRVKTDLASEIGSRDKLDDAVGKEGLDAAMRVRDRLAGKEEGPRGVYMCHGFCELGATPLIDALRRIHAYLVENPNEVLVLVIEDYVTAQDLAKAFTESGLDGLVYQGASGPPWPTLREMIDRRERLLVTTESGRPGIPWLRPAFELMQETPYKFKTPTELSCRPNRGGTSGSLFLMNNWVDTTPAPKPSNAKIVNSYDALIARAKQCQAERGKWPNIVAVDFYRTGELFRAVRELNELAAPPPPSSNP